MYSIPASSNSLFKPHPRSKFNPSEDALLKAAVADFGLDDWHRIAQRVPGRSSRQCKERWENYLSPSIGNAPWTPEEEQLLLQKYSEIGPLWKQIASFFTARTHINVKSRWNLIQRRIRRQARKVEAHRDTRQSQPPQIQELWDVPMMNVESPSDDSFSYWLDENPY
jgi:hypothetical protein